MANSTGKDGEKGAVPWRRLGWSIPIVLLALPLLLGAPWTLGDYVFAGTAFAMFGGALEILFRGSETKWYRAGAGVALVTTFLLLWINGAVGIIGSEDNPANLMFVVVILIALAGAIAVRFEAEGMARAMTVAAAAQGMIALGAFSYGLGAMEPPGLIGVVILIAAFAGLWLLSAAFFAKAARHGRA